MMRLQETADPALWLGAEFQEGPEGPQNLQHYCLSKGQGSCLKPARS